MPGAQFPIEAIGSVAAGIGHLAEAPDTDGGVRRDDATVVDYFGQQYPSFAMMAAAKSLNLGAKDIKVTPGEAVAIGMCLAARLSALLGRASLDDAQRLAALLSGYGLPTRIPAGIDAQRLLELMRLDKKNVSGRLRLILWRGIGKAEIVPDVDESAIVQILQS